MTELETEEQLSPPMSAALRDVIGRVDRLVTEVERQGTHIQSSIDLYHAILRDLKELFPRLERVERKTFALADRPAQRNCPSCGKKQQNPNATHCGMCGHGLPQ